MKLLLCLFLPISIIAQSIYDTIPLIPYKFSYQINVEYSVKGVRPHRVAQDFSYIGQDAEALQVPNEVEIEWGFDTLREEDKIYFQQFKPVNAIDYIIERSKKEQIIILNEAHHKPRHRVFTRQLLQGLYDNGYRYFGIEDINNDFRDSTQIMLDSLMQERGYPLNSPISGTYIHEPQMSNLIREAIDIGFTLFAYDRARPGDRELIQAENIKRKILDKDPQAKILIQCGWYHILEVENGNKLWMAAHLKQLCGIDPFTIYQDLLIERWCMPESPFFSLAKSEKPSLFVNEGGEVYNGKKDFSLFDALLYHPRTHYIFNRPNWLLDIPGNQFYHINKRLIQVGYPCLVKAFKTTDQAEAVPLDVIELESEWDFTALVLQPGTYRLEIRNTMKQTQDLIIKVGD